MSFARNIWHLFVSFAVNDLPAKDAVNYAIRRATATNTSAAMP
jgi:hypothetical protein